MEGGLVSADDMAPERSERVSFAAWRSLLEVHAGITRRLDAALQAQAGVSLGWYDVLVHVDEAPAGRIRLRDLEQRVLVSQSTVSRHAARMEGAGLLVRTTPPDDRRSVEVHLTETGIARLGQARAVALAEIRRRFVAGLTDDDASHLLRTLTGIRRHNRSLDDA
jgi:DNA-binding MarR family transcriptional regulator